MFYSKAGEKPISRKRQVRLSAVILTAVITLVLGISAPALWADDDEEPFDEASIFFELNDTDGDLGIHALIDGEPWKKLEIEDPRENEILDVKVSGRLRRQGLTEIFFESAEPPFDELLPEEFFDRFPEGTYEIEGETLEGDELESEVEVSHVMPAPPGNIKVNRQSAAEDCDGNLPSVPEGRRVVISWDPVTESHDEIGTPGVMVDVARYQAVAEYDVEDEEGNEVTFVFSADLPPSNGRRMSVMIPPQFIAAGLAADVEDGKFKFEILVREATGNQTAVESCFEVR
jgi:hypothetical protein